MEGKWLKPRTFQPDTLETPLANSTASLLASLFRLCKDFNPFSRAGVAFGAAERTERQDCGLRSLFEGVDV